MSFEARDGGACSCGPTDARKSPLAEKKTRLGDANHSTKWRWHHPTKRKHNASKTTTELTRHAQQPRMMTTQNAKYRSQRTSITHKKRSFPRMFPLVAVAGFWFFSSGKERRNARTTLLRCERGGCCSHYKRFATKREKLAMHKTSIQTKSNTHRNKSNRVGTCLLIEGTNSPPALLYVRVQGLRKRMPTSKNHRRSGKANTTSTTTRTTTTTLHQ